MKINKNCKKMKIDKKNCHARHAPESNLHQVEVFPYWKKKKKNVAVYILKKGWLTPMSPGSTCDLLEGVCPLRLYVNPIFHILTNIYKKILIVLFSGDL